jgi:hypothetical protein
MPHRAFSCTSAGAERLERAGEDVSGGVVRQALQCVSRGQPRLLPSFLRLDLAFEFHEEVIDPNPAVSLTEGDLGRNRCDHAACHASLFFRLPDCGSAGRLARLDMTLRKDPVLRVSAAADQQDSKTGLVAAVHDCASLFNDSEDHVQL